MKVAIVVVGLMFLGLSFAQDRSDFFCLQELRNLQSSYDKERHGLEATYIMSIEDSLRAIERFEPCFSSSRLLMELGENYARVKNYSGLSSEKYLEATQKAISFFKESGKLEPDLIGEKGSLAKRIAEEYRLLSWYYFESKNEIRYSECVDSMNVWIDIYTVSPKVIEEPKSPRKVNPAAFITDTKPKIAKQKRRVKSRRIFVLTNEIEPFKSLMDSNLRINLTPPCSTFVSAGADGLRYELLLEEGIQYRIEVSYPGYETQYAATTYGHAYPGDSIKVGMVSKGTPYTYLFDRKIDCQLDQHEILAMPNEIRSRPMLDSLLQVLGLIEQEGEPFVFRKKSNEKFDTWNDEVIQVLREHPKAVREAGHVVQIGRKKHILTNKIHVNWRIDPSDWTSEQQATIDDFMKRHSCDFHSFGYILASNSVGTGVTEMVEELNKLEVVYYAYPFIYGLNSPD